jgi:signal peptidase I
MLKRVVAVAGDPTPERFAAAARVRTATAVPPGQVLLSGDNTGASLDSRIFGYVPTARVLGTVGRIWGSSAPAVWEV